MTTGARRGELCSLKREDVDLDTGTLFVRTGLKLVKGRLVRSETKTHQQRRIALDRGRSRCFGSTQPGSTGAPSC